MCRRGRHSQAHAVDTFSPRALSPKAPKPLPRRHFGNFMNPLPLSLNPKPSSYFLVARKPKPKPLCPQEEGPAWSSFNCRALPCPGYGRKLPVFPRWHIIHLGMWPVHFTETVQFVPLYLSDFHREVGPSRFHTTGKTP